MINKNSAPQPAGVMGDLQSEVTVEAAPLLQFITRHVRSIVGLVLLLLVAIVATGVYQWHTAKTMREAHLALGKVLTATTGEDKIKALEALFKDAPESMRTGIHLELALAALQAENFDKAAEAYGEASKMDSGPISKIAAMNQADILLKAGKAEEALKVLDDIEQSIPENMRIMFLESLASTAEVAGNTARAIKAYEGIVALGPEGADAAYYQSRIQTLKNPAPASPAAPAS